MAQQVPERDSDFPIGPDRSEIQAVPSDEVGRAVAGRELIDQGKPSLETRSKSIPAILDGASVDWK